jgi:hypothetical protein
MSGKVFPLTALSQTRLIQVPHLNLTLFVCSAHSLPKANTMINTLRNVRRGVIDMKSNLQRGAFILLQARNVFVASS